jgi:hypothetical protein
MSVLPIPPPLEHLGHRPFSFYPPIVNIEHNEFQFRRATWSEILVVNTKTTQEIWIPRRFLGEISRVDEPMMILGLLKELEYEAGQIWPHERRVIEMPRAVNESFHPAAALSSRDPRQAPPARPAPVVGIRLEAGTESRIGRLIVAVMVLGVLGCFILVSVFRAGRDGSRIVYTPVLQSELGLNASDDYFAIVRKLGQPSEDRWRSDKGEIQYRILKYRDRDLAVILMGTERDKALYIGAMDNNWKPVDSVLLPGGGNTRSMLQSIQRF